MITTFAERVIIRDRARSGGKPVGPGAAASALYCVLVPALPIVAVAGCAYIIGLKAYSGLSWLFERQDVSELSLGVREFLAEEEVGELQDGGMEGGEIYLTRTEPVGLISSSALVESGVAPPLLEGAAPIECPRCKDNMCIVDFESVSCTRCGYGPTKVRSARRGRSRYCRGHFNMIRDAIKEFPQRMEHPNRGLAQQQVYTYMLRRSKELRWTVKDQTLLPALAAMAFLVRTRGEIDARKMQQSAFAEAAAYEYEVAGSRYPNFKRVYDTLRFYA